MCPVTLLPSAPLYSLAVFSLGSIHWPSLALTSQTHKACSHIHTHTSLHQYIMCKNTHSSLHQCIMCKHTHTHTDSCIHSMCVHAFIHVRSLLGYYMLFVTFNKINALQCYFALKVILLSYAVHSALCSTIGYQIRQSGNCPLVLYV